MLPTITQVTEDIARVCHEANRALCEAFDDVVMEPWDECSVGQRESCMDGVRFHVMNPHAGPEASHKNWREFKEENGWTYGDIKDEELKTHPCMVPFNKLPKHQQAKDYVFRAIVHTLNP